jgi:hypothetical protein
MAWGDNFSKSPGSGWKDLLKSLPSFCSQSLVSRTSWGLFIKSLLRFCLPKQGLMMMARVSVERSWEVQVAGAGLLVLAGLLGYGVYAG